MRSDDVQDAARLQLEVVIAASMVYFCLVLCYGNSIQVWKYVYNNNNHNNTNNNNTNNNKSCCCCQNKSPTISFLCFVAIVCGFLVQLWTIVVDLRALTLMKRLKAEGRFHMEDLDNTTNPMTILMAIDIQTELAIQNVLHTLFDIGFVTLGLHVVSLPWREFYKTCVTRRSVVGTVVLLKTVLALRYLSSLRHYAATTATNTASSLLFPLVVSFLVEFVVLVGILLAWFNTLHGSSILELARHGRHEEDGYKTYGWFLLLHIVSRIVCFLVVLVQLVSKIRADYYYNYNDDDNNYDDVFHEHLHQRDQHAAPLSLWLGTAMIVERLTPLLVLAGVAYHWSNHNDDNDDDEPAAFESLALAPDGDEGIQLA